MIYEIIIWLYYYTWNNITSLTEVCEMLACWTNWVDWDANKIEEDTDIYEHI